MIAAPSWPPSGAYVARIDWCDLNSSRAAGKGTPGELDKDTSLLQRACLLIESWPPALPPHGGASNDSDFKRLQTQMRLDRGSRCPEHDFTGSAKACRKLSASLALS